MGVLRRAFEIIILIHAVNQVSSNPIAQYVLPNGQTPPRTSLSPNTQLLKKPLKSDITSGPLDSNVLNNLAIALQLLIVSNIMNMPADEKIKQKLELLGQTEKPTYIPMYESVQPSIHLDQALRYYSYEATKPIYEAIPKSMYYEQPKSLYYDKAMPSAKFLGASGYSDPILGSINSKANPRTSMTLMSPYDALGSSLDSPSFPTSYSKKDFQSPYAAILAADGARDLFSMSDFF